jgi:hypothetical protein
MKTDQAAPLLARLSVKIPPDRPQEGAPRPERPQETPQRPPEPPSTLYTMIARETTDDN